MRCGSGGWPTTGVVELDWRIFSLELNSSELDAPFWEACRRQGEALVALALARREGGDEAFDRLYGELGLRVHEEKQEMSPELVRACADAAGMPDLVDRAIAIPELADEVRQEFLDARQESVFGVPTLGIADLTVIYGPVFALAPERRRGGATLGTHPVAGGAPGLLRDEAMAARHPPRGDRSPNRCLDRGRPLTKR